MKTQIEGIAGKLRAMLVRAEAMAESDNDDTADRYENVAEALEAALAALDDAIAAFD